MWQAADQGRITIGFPALAVIVAGIALQASARDWDAMLWPATITVLPLGVTPAVEIPTWTGELGARHALWEAGSRLPARLVPSQPGLYVPGQVDIQAV